MPNAPMFETRAMGCEEVDARMLNRDLAEDTGADLAVKPKTTTVMACAGLLAAALVRRARIKNPSAFAIATLSEMGLRFYAAQTLADRSHPCDKNMHSARQTSGHIWKRVIGDELLEAIGLVVESFQVGHSLDAITHDVSEAKLSQVGILQRDFCHAGKEG